jgi:hypothetical protein
MMYSSHSGAPGKSVSQIYCEYSGAGSEFKSMSDDVRKKNHRENEKISVRYPRVPGLDETSVLTDRFRAKSNSGPLHGKHI